MKIWALFALFYFCQGLRWPDARLNLRITQQVYAVPSRRPSPQSRPKSAGAGEDGGTRVNKCLQGLSRRAADAAVEEGRVYVNGKIATSGLRVSRGDVVRLDGQFQHWEVVAAAKKNKLSTVLEERSFVYLKYWKPAGVTCTSDPSDKTNIISAGKFDLFPQRLFTVGRLDKDSTGLILLTSDGRLNNALLSPHANKEKVYVVETSRPATDEQVRQLANGVVITTTSQRDGGKDRTITAPTLPCKVRRISAGDASILSRTLEFTLTEGRNRQIRKMVEAIGMQVVTLHRVGFCGLTLKGLAKNNWLELSEGEMKVVASALVRAGGAGAGAGAGEEVEEE